MRHLVHICVCVCKYVCVSVLTNKKNSGSFRMRQTIICHGPYLAGVFFKRTGKESI